MKTVLLTAIGSASASAACARLKAAGYRVAGVDIYPASWNAVAQDVDWFLQAPRASEGEAYVSFMLQTVRERGVDYIVPLTDVEVDALCGRKAEFLALGAVVCTPDAEVARHCRDKLRMSATLRDARLCDVISTYLPGDVPPALPYPRLLKPLHGRSSEGRAVAEDELAYRAALATRDDYIVQPFIPGDVWCVDTVRDAFGNAYALPRHELLRTATGLGLTVDVRPGHALATVCERIVSHVGLIGAVNIEFIENKGSVYFLEINPRFSGGVVFSCLAGYDMPLNHIRAHAGEMIDPPGTVKGMTIARGYEARITREDA